MSYYQINSPLVLSGDPEHPMHAVTKQYVDARAGVVDGDRYQTGTLSVDKLPALSGDVASDAGSNVLRLADSGVTAGVYFRVDVDSKGRVVGGSTSHHSEGREISWSWVIGKPTTLAGFGIGDVLSSSGGTVSAKLSSTVVATGANHAVTKGKVDEIVGNISVSAADTGDVVRTTSSETPSGFLRANGGVIDKTLYSDLYAVLGDRYTTVTDTGNASLMGQPWRQQYAFNDRQSAVLGAWTTGTSLPATAHASQAIVTKNRVYLLGGHNGFSFLSTVYTAPILEDGTLGAWTTGTSLPTAVSFSQAIVTKNRVYLLGGHNGFSFLSTVYTAPILEDGTLGAWTTGTSLPTAVSFSQAIVTKNRVYLLGGHNGSSFLSTVYTAPILEDGTLGTWTTATSLPAAVAHSQAIVTKNRVYLLGGYNNVSGHLSTVYTAPINEDGTLGTWTTATSLPAAVAHSQAIVTKNRVYLLGGYNNVSGHLSTVYTAPINEDGTLGTWTTATSLPAAVADSQAIVTSSKLYLLGNTLSPHNQIYSCDFAGGVNDYQTLIANGSLIPTDKFKLPDFSSKETDGLYYYIKT